MPTKDKETRHETTQVASAPDIYQCIKCGKRATAPPALSKTICNPGRDNKNDGPGLMFDTGPDEDEETSDERHSGTTVAGARAGDRPC